MISTDYFPKQGMRYFTPSNQDAMNIAFMYTDFPISPLGREAMGFEQGGAVMYHTVGAKAWNGTLRPGHSPGIRLQVLSATISLKFQDRLFPILGWSSECASLLAHSLVLSRDSICAES